MHTSSMDFNIPTPTLLEISIKLHYIYLNFVVLEISSFPWNFQAGLGWGGGGGENSEEFLMELHHESFPQTAGIVTACSEGGHHQQIAG